MSRVTLILGPPGTGKTTRIMTIVQEAIQSGIPANRIACATFTKKATQEIVDRACAKFKLSHKSFPHFRTLHSMAFRDINVEKESVMDTRAFRGFGKYIGGYDFRHDYDENVERMAHNGGVGDRCMALYALAKSRMLPLHTVWMEEPQAVDWPVLNYFAQALDKFKRQRNMVDFTDFFELSNKVLDVELFILDEAQDLTTQQWEYARKISKSAKKVYVAGDDDQAIFQWAGADVGYMHRLNGERIILPHSYRLPESIHGLANHIAEGITHRFKKTWSPKAEKGSVNYVQMPEEVDLSDLGKSWYILARHKYQLPHLEKMVRQRGFAYAVADRSSIQEPDIQAILQYETLRRGLPLTSLEAKNLSRFVSFMAYNPELDSISWDDVKWKFAAGERPIWVDGVDRIGEEPKQYVRAMIRNGEPFKGDPRITINTIHAVKGGERDNVLLCSAMSPRAYNVYSNDPDQEHRVWYVGVSRAKQNLFITLPRGRRHVQRLFY